MDMCSNCLDEFAFLPYQYSILKQHIPTIKGIGGVPIISTTVEVQESFCCFMCMKFWFEDEEKERGWVETR